MVNEIKTLSLIKAKKYSFIGRKCISILTPNFGDVIEGKGEMFTVAVIKRIPIVKFNPIKCQTMAVAHYHHDKIIRSCNTVDMCVELQVNK